MIVKEGETGLAGYCRLAFETLLELALGKAGEGKNITAKLNLIMDMPYIGGEGGHTDHATRCSKCNGDLPLTCLSVSLLRFQPSGQYLKCQYKYYRKLMSPHHWAENKSNPDKESHTWPMTLNMS